MLFLTMEPSIVYPLWFPGRRKTCKQNSFCVGVVYATYGSHEEKSDLMEAQKSTAGQISTISFDAEHPRKAVNTVPSFWLALTRESLFVNAVVVVVTYYCVSKCAVLILFWNSNIIFTNILFVFQFWNVILVLTD